MQFGPMRVAELNEDLQQMHCFEMGFSFFHFYSCPCPTPAETATYCWQELALFHGMQCVAWCHH